MERSNQNPENYSSFGLSPPCNFKRSDNQVFRVGCFVPIDQFTGNMVT